MPVRTQKTMTDRKTKEKLGVKKIVVKEYEAVRLGVTLDRLAKLLVLKKVEVKLQVIHRN